ncbi:hypothetical protein G7K_4020-t1 [Saitoella complicata NRRL Y-17804]|uniref:Protein kinase domain-containing protein n=2 Tax=Saitoella complicata (strain BCRC 22490 / CBS 7301 / JCM 7358 / NBRC 10748 / NRRL Y-17804) TaxID=698492 RepID=A0A0E9NJA5_SAICN|nr:hypothetical protein G7K_4020-t1 [Saitoella complicata NRRL Y-17804]
MSDPIDFAAIETQKENIEPKLNGHRATNLRKAFGQKPDERQQQRASFEQELEIALEVDDPLDIWVRYVKWIQASYPAGQSSESGLVNVLERATKAFEGESWSQYLNDPRYLRLWCDYTRYSDSPREVYAYLFKNRVGLDLAMFYEEYAGYLESIGRSKQANDVFVMGIARRARPVERLQRTYSHFQARQAAGGNGKSEGVAGEVVRPALGGETGGLGTEQELTGLERQSAKLDVFADGPGEDEYMPAAGASAWGSLGTLEARKKENGVKSTTWAGQTLKSSTAVPTSSLAGAIYTDEVEDDAFMKSLPAYKPFYSVANGKQMKVQVHYCAIYADGEEEEEYSFAEVRAKSRGLNAKQLVKRANEEESGGGKAAEEARRAAEEKVRQEEELRRRAQEEAAKKAEEERRKKEGEARLAAEQQAREEAARLAAEGKARQEEAARIAAEEQRKREEEAAAELELTPKAAPREFSIAIAQTPLKDEDAPRRKVIKCASPTINTKAAMDDVLDLFNAPLRCEREESDDSEEDSDEDEDEDMGDTPAAEIMSEVVLAGEDGDSESDSDEDVEGDEREEDDLVTPMKKLDIFVDPTVTLQQQPAPELPPPAPPVFQDENENAQLPPPKMAVPATPQQQAPMPTQPRGFSGVPFNLMTPIVETPREFAQSTVRRAPLAPVVPQTPLAAYSQEDEPMSSPMVELPPPRRAPLAAKKPVLGVKKDAPVVEEGPIVKETVCNPMDEGIRQQIYGGLKYGPETFQGYHGEMAAHEAGKTDTIGRALKAGKPCSVELAGTVWHVKKKLGEGAFAPVYLVESDAGELIAMKVERPPSPWEFYIFRAASRRLGVSRANESIVHAKEFHAFADEGYLLLEYHNQGTMLDLVNLFRGGEGGAMDEILAMFFTVELLRAVEGLHAKGVIHGDLKPDNCLLRLESGEITSPAYRRDGSRGWNLKGVTLIDFGRGIDMKVFGEGVQFIADWETDAMDCAEMREARPWTYQVDYHGVAAIAHSLLFGSYIETMAESVGIGRKHYRITKSYKRYQQQELWSRLFEVLLNPVQVATEAGRGTALPILEEVRGVREGMEGWLEQNCEKGVGLRGLLKKIEGQVAAGRKR